MVPTIVLIAIIFTLITFILYYVILITDDNISNIKFIILLSSSVLSSIISGYLWMNNILNECNNIIKFYYRFFLFN